MENDFLCVKAYFLTNNQKPQSFFLPPQFSVLSPPQFSVLSPPQSSDLSRQQACPASANLRPSLAITIPNVWRGLMPANLGARSAGSRWEAGSQRVRAGRGCAQQEGVWLALALQVLLQRLGVWDELEPHSSLAGVGMSGGQFAPIILRNS